MIKLSHEIFIALVVTLCLITAEARFYPPKSILHGGNAEVLNILLRGNGNPEISTVLSNNLKPNLRIGNPAVADTHRENPKPAIFAGGYPNVVIPIGNPAVETMLRDYPRAILRSNNPEISVMIRDNPKPFLLSAIPELPAIPRDSPKTVILAGIPEISASLDGNPETNPQGGGNLKLLAMLREYAKPVLSNPAVLRVRKHSESDHQLIPTSSNNKYTIKDNDLKETFNRMIETVAVVNDERIQSLKKLFELENYLPQVLRTQEKNPLIAIIMNTPNYKSKYDNLNINHLTEDPEYMIVKKKLKEPSMQNILNDITEGTYFDRNEDSDEVSISHETEESPFTQNFYLRGWNGCKKNAAKFCRKACDKALKRVCDDYQCSKKFKKDGKKECKKKCKAEFIDGDGSSSDE